jgi:hypothetical protein
MDKVQQKGQGDNGPGSFQPWAVTGYWAVAALTSSIIPFFLLILYQHVPWAREVLETGQDKNVVIPLLGWVGYRCRGQALWFLLATSVTYGGLGIWLCVKGATLSYGKALRIFVSEHFFLLAVALMFVVLPTISVCWAIALDRNAIPIGTWGEYGGNHGRWYRVYDLRYLLNLTFNMPLLGLMSGAASAFVRLSTSAFLACVANAAVFLSLIYTHYWLVD